MNKTIFYVKMLLVSIIAILAPIIFFGFTHSPAEVKNPFFITSIILSIGFCFSLSRFFFGDEGKRLLRGATYCFTGMGVASFIFLICFILFGRWIREFPWLSVGVVIACTLPFLFLLKLAKEKETEKLVQLETVLIFVMDLASFLYGSFFV